MGLYKHITHKVFWGFWHQKQGRKRRSEEIKIQQQHGSQVCFLWSDLSCLDSISLSLFLLQRCLPFRIYSLRLLVEMWLKKSLNQNLFFCNWNVISYNVTFWLQVMDAFNKCANGFVIFGVLGPNCADSVVPRSTLGGGSDLSVVILR